MGFIDDKKNVFNEIGALTSIKGGLTIPDSTNSLSSINNKKDVVSFLLDLLTVLTGSESLQKNIGELMTTFLDDVEPTLKTELKKQLLDYNSNEELPISFTSGYVYNVKDIDTYGKLKTDPNSDIGTLLYNNDVNDFDKRAYESIVNSGTDVTFNNVVLNYDENLDQITVKPTSTGDTINNFVETYIDGLKLIDKKGFITLVINSIFGTISNKQKKTIQQAIVEEKLNKTIEKIIDNEDNINISDSELRLIEENAQKTILGIQTVDLGCGVLNNVVTVEYLTDLVNKTSGSTNPLDVGNAYVDLISEGFSTTNPEKAKEDFQTIKDGFFKRLIKAIVNTLVFAITSTPQIRLLISLFDTFKNNGIVQISDPVEDIKNKQNLISCLSKKTKTTIIEYLFNVVKSEMIKLIVPVSKIIIREKINQYLGIIKSLVSF